MDLKKHFTYVQHESQTYCTNKLAI